MSLGKLLGAVDGTELGSCDGLLLGTDDGSVLGTSLGNALVLGIKLGEEDGFILGIDVGEFDGEEQPDTMTSPVNTSALKSKVDTLTFISIESGS